MCAVVCVCVCGGGGNHGKKNCKHPYHNMLYAGGTEEKWRVVSQQTNI